MPSHDYHDVAVTRPFVIKSEDLNHHQTLYGGRCVEWAVQTAYITAANCFDDVRRIVFMSIHSLSVRAPARLGEIVQFTGSVDYVGEAIIGIRVDGRKMHPKDDPRLVATGTFLFCTVDEKGRAVPHGLPELASKSASAEDRWKKAAEDATLSLR